MKLPPPPWTYAPPIPRPPHPAREALDNLRRAAGEPNGASR